MLHHYPYRRRSRKILTPMVQCSRPSVLVPTRQPSQSPQGTRSFIRSMGSSAIFRTKCVKLIVMQSCPLPSCLSPKVRQHPANPPTPPSISQPHTHRRRTRGRGQRRVSHFQKTALSPSNYLRPLTSPPWNVHAVYSPVSRWTLSPRNIRARPIHCGLPRASVSVGCRPRVVP